MTNAWNDGIVASVFTVVWVIYVLVISSFRADKLQLHMRWRVIFVFVGMIANLILGAVYVVIALVQGYPKKFDAQATLATMAAYIVSLAVEFPPLFKMYRNSAELDLLLSRRKFKPGDNRPVSPRKNIVLEVVKSKPRNAGSLVANYGGEVYVINNKSYVHSPLGETYLLGVPPGDIHMLFTGHSSIQDLKIMRSIELALLPTDVLRSRGTENRVDMCTFFLVAVASNEGCRASLYNWKSTASGIPPWVRDVVGTIMREFVITARDHLGNLVNNHCMEDLCQTLFACGNTNKHDVSLAVSLMVLLHSEGKNFASAAITKINNYYEEGFDYPDAVNQDELRGLWKSLWHDVTITMFNVTKRT